MPAKTHSGSSPFRATCSKPVIDNFRQIGLSTHGSNDVSVTEVPWLKFNPGIIDTVI
jgi:hypothetical protein